MLNESVSPLVNQAKAGDQDAFTKLVEWFQPVVFGIAYSITGDRVAAEDLAQDAFLACWENLGRLHTPAGFPLWIRKTIRSLSYNWVRSAVYRRRLVERRALLEPADAPSQTAEARLARDDGRQRIAEALQILPESLREAIVIYYLQGKSPAETAAALGISEQAMRQRLKRGRDLLRAHFEQRWEQQFDEELSDLVPRRVLKQFSAALALGVVWPELAKAATRTGPSLYFHHLMHEAAPWKTWAIPAAILGTARRWPAAAWVLPIALLFAGAAVWYFSDTDSSVPARAETTAPASSLISTETQPTTSSPQPPAPALTTPVPPLVDPYAGQTISGTVVDKTGAPIAEAALTAYTGSYTRDDILCHVCLKRVAEEAPAYSAKTDAAGHYTVTGIECDRDLLVVAGAQTFATDLREHVLPDATGVDFVLPDANQLYGLVLDAETRGPVPQFEAKVTCIYTDPEATHLCQGSDYPWQLFHAGDGTFVLSTDRYEQVEIGVRAIGYVDYLSEIVSLKPDGPPVQLTVELKPGRTITGYVVDERGAPVPQALVTKVDEKATPDFPKTQTGHTSAFTDAAGQFELTGISDEDALHFIAAWHADFAPGFAPNPSPDQEQPAIIRLERPGTVQGFVHKGDQPGTWLRIRARLPIGHPYRLYSNGVPTDDTGHFTLTQLPAGVFSIEVYDRKAEQFLACEPLEVKPGAVTPFDLDLNGLGVIRGVVAGTARFDDPHISLRRPGLINFFFHNPLPPNKEFQLTIDQPGLYEIVVYEHEKPLFPILSYSVQATRGETVDLTLEIPPQ